MVYEENDTELSEDEERHEKKDAEAPCFHFCFPPYGPTGQHSLSPQVDADDVEFHRLGQPKMASDSEDDGDSDKESSVRNMLR